MVVARHNAESCPAGTVRPDKGFTTKVEESMKKSGVKEIAGYSDAPGHVHYFVLETDDNKALNNAVEPLRLLGEVTITPVLKWSDTAAWAKQIGIQK
jgi:hypothetical protein